MQFDLSCSKVQELLDKHELKSNAPVLLCHTIDLRKGTSWEKITWVGQPQALYEGTESVRRGERFVNDLKVYAKKAPTKYSGFRCEKMLPFKMAGIPFFGL